MKLRGISLTTLILVVAIIAADLGLLKNLYLLKDYVGNRELFVAIGLLPMANLLAFNFPRLLWFGLRDLLQDVRYKPFAVGFQLTSWPATLVALTIDMAAIGSVFAWFESCLSSLARVVPLVRLLESCNEVLQNPALMEVICEFLPAMACFSGPPLLVSLAGGAITRLVVRRRSSAEGLAGTDLGRVGFQPQG